MCLAQGPQRSDAGEARTRGPSVSSQALYFPMWLINATLSSKLQKLNFRLIVSNIKTCNMLTNTW